MDLLVNYGIKASQEAPVTIIPVDYYWNNTETRQESFQRGYYESELPYVIQMLSDVKASTPTVTNLTTSGSGNTGGARFLGNYWYANGSYPHNHYRRTGSITGSQSTFSTSGVGREYDLTFNNNGTKIIVNDYRHRWNWNGTVYTVGSTPEGADPTPIDTDFFGYVFAHSSVGTGCWILLVSETSNVFYYTFRAFSGYSGSWTYWSQGTPLSDITNLRHRFQYYDVMIPYEYITGSAGSYEGTDFALINYNSFYENRNVASSIGPVVFPSP